MSLVTNAMWFVINGCQYVIVGVFSAVLMTIASIAGPFGWVAFSLSVARRYWAPTLLKLGNVKLDVRGLDNVDWTQPVVVVANHQSMVDIPALQAALPINLRFIAKEELLSVPFLGRYMKVAGMIGIDRKQPLAALERIQQDAASATADNAAVVAFAEGTRTRTGEIAPFKPGAILLAQQAGLAIVPLSIHGAREVLLPDQMGARPGTIRIDIGKPIATVGIPRRVLLQQVHGAVVAMNVAAGGKGAAPRRRTAVVAAEEGADVVVAAANEEAEPADALAG